ncbi:MAG: glycosyltransferase [Chitinophagales bacterium]
MRILHIVPNLSKGGAERLALDICTELSSRSGVKAALVALNPHNEYSDFTKAIDYRVIPSKYIPSLRGKAVVEIEALAQFIRDFKPDVIHSHLFEAEMVSRHVAYGNAKWFSHCHDNMKQLKSFSWDVLTSKVAFTDYYERRLLLKAYSKCSNSFIAISKHTQDYFLSNLPLQFRDRIFLLHNAIRFHAFNAVCSVKECTPLHLVNVGSFVAKKNQQFLVDVVHCLVKKNIAVKLTMLGDGILRKAVQEKVNKLGLEQYISLPGNVANVPQYLSEASIYVHSATYEPFGLVLLEAMAAGLPIVSLDGGGNRDIIEEGENGYLLTEQNPEIFATAILKLAADKVLYRKMSDYAVAYARQHDIASYTDKLLQLYQK